MVWVVHSARSNTGQYSSVADHSNFVHIFRGVCQRLGRGTNYEVVAHSYRIPHVGVYFVSSLVWYAHKEGFQKALG